MCLFSGAEDQWQPVASSFLQIKSIRKEVFLRLQGLGGHSTNLTAQMVKEITAIPVKTHLKWFKECQDLVSLLSRHWRQ